MPSDAPEDAQEYDPDYEQLVDAPPLRPAWCRLLSGPDLRPVPAPAGPPADAPGFWPVPVPAGTRTVAPVEVPEPVGTRAAARAVSLDHDCRAFESTEGRYGGDEEYVRAMPVGFDVLASANAYHKRFRCRVPAGFDFRRERLAIYRFHHETPESMTFSHAIEENGRLKVVLEASSACQGTAPALHRSVLGFALPREPVPVDLVACTQPQEPCSGGLP